MVGGANGEQPPSTAAAGGPPPRPTITLPPRASVDTLYGGGAPFVFSPGPMTLVSNFFADNNNDDCKSFSQLLAGAMTSPMGMFTVPPGLLSPAGLLDSPSFFSSPQVKCLFSSCCFWSTGSSFSLCLC